MIGKRWWKIWQIPVTFHLLITAYKAIASQVTPMPIEIVHSAPNLSVGLLLSSAWQLFAPMMFVGSCNRDLFETWLIDCLLPENCSSSDALVIDNASFHRSQALEAVVAQAGCVLYLPPYSPDMNESEHW